MKLYIKKETLLFILPSLTGLLLYFLLIIFLNYVSNNPNLFDDGCRGTATGCNDDWASGFVFLIVIPSFIFLPFVITILIGKILKMKNFVFRNTLAGGTLYFLGLYLILFHKR